MTGYLLILVVSVLTCAGQLCQKLAALRWRQFQARQNRRATTLGWLLAALILLALALALWLNVLQRLPLSLAYPVLSVNFVLVTLAAYGIFHEPITPRHWWGVASIMLGILLMSLNP
ncbi:4-amino-4-deoxy-L-arabinose-phosphoundecaprenol flippase subunit ArnE [Acerihabitans arboris]|uniref:Probable 4-amino-4-deoxy-L-arabinose-phosphoundecaprenol flippase subunit ArnE n=1 Tax=Acerihabitans arboris TaxID=2691583 RepID=A0A845SRD5_9GAMM|nr:4-amino-4-deoxy-L-arabinose-phosphoundecaprenol flippase subunit ArnE [Acerihabitans arboris]NDL63695.1 4-amino-4-deoxy-L-arabinose-phosphoundecaprenol flippase subunit ArnE [Acerihabitans arboris]